MTCDISILDIYGTTNTSGDLLTVVVRGTATGCDSLLLFVVFDRSGTTTWLGYPEVTVDGSGSWIFVFEKTAYPDPFAKHWPFGLECGSTISVIAQCTDDPECKDDLIRELECHEASSCPESTWRYDGAGSCDDGTRSVSLSCEVTSSSGDTVEAQLKQDGAVVDGPRSGTGTVTLSFTGDLAPGSYTFSVSLLTPAGCPGSSLIVVVEDCDCPEFEFDDDPGSCNEDNTHRSVILKAIRTDSGDPCAVYWDYGDGSISPSKALSTGDAITETHELPPGSNTAKLVIVLPEGCPPQPYTFSLDACEEPPEDKEDPPKDEEDPVPDEDEVEDGGGGGCLGCSCTILGGIWAGIVATLLVLLVFLLPIPVVGMIYAGVVAGIMVLGTTLYVSICRWCAWAKWTIAGVASAVLIISGIGVLTAIGAIAVSFVMGAIISAAAAALGISAAAVYKWIRAC